jgi:hypothetical protein
LGLFKPSSENLKTKRKEAAEGLRSSLAAIEAAMPATAVAGTRYATQLMAHLDSEH